MPNSTASEPNTGVGGTRHEVASPDPAKGEAAPDPQANLEIAHPQPAYTKIIAGRVITAGDEEPAVDSTAAPEPGYDETESGYDETSGIVYERQHNGFEIIGLDGVDDTGSGHADPAGAAAETEAFPSGAEPLLEHAPPAQPAGEDEESPRLGRIGQVFGRVADAVDGDDDAPPLTRVRDLPLDQKMRIWRLRALIVIVVGVVFSVIANWEIGITLAVVAGIADTVYRSRTVESHAWPQEGTVDRATWRAQKRTIKQLHAMARSGYVALNRRPIPDSVEVIDHLLIGPTGVYAIDSEKWDKALPIRTRNGKQLWLGPESKKDRLEHARWEAERASNLLTDKLDMEITVRPALAIYGPPIPWDIAVIREVDVFSGDRLRKYLHRRARRKDVPHLSREQIAKIHQAAVEVLPLEWQGTPAPVG